MGGLVTGARVFYQTVDDQIVTLFGVRLRRGFRRLGHYYVASAGDSMRRMGRQRQPDAPGRVRASVDYTNAQTIWLRPSPDAGALSIAAVIAVAEDGLHDVRRRSWTVPVTERAYSPSTDQFVTLAMRTATGIPGARFDVQVSQSLPFMYSSAANGKCSSQCGASSTTV